MKLRDLLRRVTSDPVRPHELKPVLTDAEQWTDDLATVHLLAAETSMNAAEVERQLQALRTEVNRGG